MEFRATLAPPNRKFRSHSAASSEGETSPSSTPEVARKHLKSLGASAQRSVSSKFVCLQSSDVETGEGVAS